jgi:hypothetical protein
MLADVEVSANVQPDPWVTVKGRPAIVAVPLRCGPVLAPTWTLTWPLPEPAAPLWIEIHSALLVAFHVQPAPLVTCTSATPPLEGTFAPAGAIE